MGTPAQGESSAQTGSWMVRWQQPAFQLAAGCVHSRSGNFANGDRSQTTRQLLAQYREGAINLVAIVQDRNTYLDRGTGMPAPAFSAWATGSHPASNSRGRSRTSTTTAAVTMTPPFTPWVWSMR